MKKEMFMDSNLITSWGMPLSRFCDSVHEGKQNEDDKKVKIFMTNSIYTLNCSQFKKLDTDTLKQKYASQLLVFVVNSAMKKGDIKAYVAMKDDYMFIEKLDLKPSLTREHLFNALKKHLVREYYDLYRDTQQGLYQTFSNVILVENCTTVYALIVPVLLAHVDLGNESIRKGLAMLTNRVCEDNNIKLPKY
mgnify:FL=1